MTVALPDKLVKQWIIKSSSEKLNNFLGGGFVRGIVYTIFSRQDRGKTNTCLDFAFNAGEEGFWIAYIDGDNHGVNVFRLYDIIKARYPDAKILHPKQVHPKKVYNYYEKLLKKYNIDIFWEATLGNLKKRCLELANKNKYTIIIVDSVTLFYGEYVTVGTMTEKKEGTADITKIYSKLREAVLKSEHLKVLIFTTQRASDVKESTRLSNIEKKQKLNIQIDSSDREEIDRHMGGKSPGYFSDVIIQLTKFKKIRKAEYIKNRLGDSDKTAEFQIINKGIV